MKVLLKTVAAAALVAGASQAQAITWADWTFQGGTVSSGTIAATTISLSGGGWHTSQIAPSAFNPWLSAPLTPWAAYDGIQNVPNNTDFISPARNGRTYTFTFGTVVSNPVIAIVSLGRPLSVANPNPTTWTFNVPFIVLDEGEGFFGGTGNTFGVAGNVLSGSEVSGVIRLLGTSNTFTVITNNTEDYSGLTVGFVPEPQTWGMLIAGFALIGAAARRRRTIVAA